MPKDTEIYGYWAPLQQHFKNKKAPKLFFLSSHYKPCRFLVSSAIFRLERPTSRSLGGSYLLLALPQNASQYCTAWLHEGRKSSSGALKMYFKMLLKWKTVCTGIRGELNPWMLDLGTTRSQCKCNGERVSRKIKMSKGDIKHLLTASPLQITLSQRHCKRDAVLAIMANSHNILWEINVCMTYTYIIAGQDIWFTTLGLQS